MESADMKWLVFSALLFLVAPTAEAGRPRAVGFGANGIAGAGLQVVDVVN
jgi:hypothetical protein